MAEAFKQDDVRSKEEIIENFKKKAKGEKMDKYEYYVIVNRYNLQFVDQRGYATSKVKDARKFLTYASF